MARALLAALAATVVLAGCIAPSGDRPLNLGVPGALLETHAGVSYYPACGNETLTYGGRTWYPFRPSNLDEFPTVTASGGRGFAIAPLPAVAAPGPGDDVGTLTIYAKGFAHWESDSGDLDTWLTTRTIEYGWVC